MHFIFVLAVVALGSATSLYGVQKDIRVHDDRIVIRMIGKIVVIEKPKDDEKGVQIFIKDQDRLIRKVKIDKDKQIVMDILSMDDALSENLSEERNKEITPFEEHTVKTRLSGCSNMQDTKTQMAVLVTIFKKYDGVIEEETFRELLKELKQAVDSNECHPVILDVLRQLEVKTYAPVDSAMRRQGNSQALIRDLWKLKDMTRDRPEDHHRRRSLFDRSNMQEQENQVNQGEQVARQIEWIQQILKNRHEQLDDTIPTTTSSFKDTKSTDLPKEAMLKQLVYQSNTREIQGQILHHQLRVQQLQLQQQFLSQRKQQIKLQITMGQQHGMPYTKMQDLNRAREGLQKREQELLETQINLHSVIQKLQQELTRQEEKLRECLENERKEDEKSIMKMS